MALCHATMTGLSTLLTLPISSNQQKPRERSRGCFSLISKKKNMKGMLFAQRFYKGKHPFVKHGQVSNVPDCPKSMARLLPSTLLDTETTWTAFPPCVHFGCSCLHSYKYIHMLMTTQKSVQRDTRKLIAVFVFGLGLELPRKQKQRRNDQEKVCFKHECTRVLIVHLDPKIMVS